MKALNWKQTGWFAKNFIFTMEQQIIGQLKFSNFWGSDAAYTDQNNQLKYTPKSFWDRSILVTKNGKSIAEIQNGVFGERTLKLESEEKFIITTSFWEQEVYWKNEEGKVVIQYQQAAMSSMEKGLISVKESLPIEKEKLLISSGLFIRQTTLKQRVRMIAVIILIIATGSQF